MSEENVISRIVHDLAACGVGSLNEAQRELLALFVEEIEIWNDRIHLVGKRNIRKTLSNLVVDSWLLHRFAHERGLLTPAEHAEPPGEGSGVMVADIGAGAGFPGVVWKIAEPEIDVTLFERREKALLFLERVIAMLKADGIRAVGGDAGRIGGEGRYDVVISKAAGRVQRIEEAVTRLLRKDGVYITVKGSGWKAEAARTNRKKLRLAAAERLPRGRGTVLLFDRDS